MYDAHLINAVTFGLMAACSWGCGDFIGGVAARSLHIFRVVAISSFISLILVLGLGFYVHESAPTLSDLARGAGAGVFGTLGDTALWYALSYNHAAVVAPITGIIGAFIPVLWSISFKGTPPGNTLFGITLGLISMVLVSNAKMNHKIDKNIWLAIFAGFGYGIYFVILHEIPQNHVYFPLASSRVVSVLIMLSLIYFNRSSMKIHTLSTWSAVLVNGPLETYGNVFFIQSTYYGYLDIAAVMASLYPAVTIMLAVMIYREHVSKMQTIGIILGLASIAIICF